MRDKYEFSLIIEQDEDGMYVGTVPSLRGCHTQAKDIGTLIERAKEAITLCMQVEKDIPRLKLNVLKAIVDEAHKHNLRMMVHTGSPDEMRDVVSTGAESIEHGILPGTRSTEIPDDLIRT